MEQEKAASDRRATIASVASERAERYSAGREEPRRRAAGANPQPNSLRTLRAVSFVGRGVTVDVDSRIHVAANEMDADEAAAAWRGIVGVAATIGKTSCQIEMLANH